LFASFSSLFGNIFVIFFSPPTSEPGFNGVGVTLTSLFGVFLTVLDGPV
jgi:hypothetical protein